MDRLHPDTRGTTTVDVPVHAIVVDPANTNIVYAGSDVGVWKGVKTPGQASWTWQLFSDGLPECAVHDLTIHAGARLLRAATHGRGAWEIPIPAVAVTPADPDIYVRANAADSGRMRDGARMPWIVTAPDPAAPSATANLQSSADIKAQPASQRAFYIGQSGGSPPPPVPYLPVFDHVDFARLSSSASALDAAGPNQVIVQVHNRSAVPVPAGQVSVLLLLTSPALPPLPANYASQIRAKGTTWLAGSGWKFADPANPYRTTTGPLSALAPQLVFYTVDLAALGLAIVAAVFVLGPNEQLLANETSLTALIQKDKHVAARLLPLSSPSGRATGPMYSLRGQHQASLLNDGRVLVTGGEAQGFGGDPHRTSEIYTPGTGAGRNAWVRGPDLHDQRIGHTAVTLPDGTVLLAGGSPDGRSAELFDPAATPQAFVALPQMNLAHYGLAGVYVPQARQVLIAGAGDGDAACEYFDPATRMWRLLTNCVVPGQKLAARAFCNTLAAIMDDGRVLLYGTIDPATRAPHWCRIFDPSTESLSSPPLPQSQFIAGSTLTALASGELILVGDAQNEMEPDTNNRGRHVLTLTCEIFDPVHVSWRSVRTKFYGRFDWQQAVVLDDDRLLLCGGGSRATLTYDCWSGDWLQSPPLLSPSRFLATATLLQDGTVLVAGGDVADPALAGEVYTPVSAAPVLAGGY